MRQLLFAGYTRRHIFTETEFPVSISESLIFINIIKTPLILHVEGAFLLRS